MCVCVLFVCNAVSTLLESACGRPCTLGLCEGHVYDVRLLCVVYRVSVCCLLCSCGRVFVRCVRVFVCCVFVCSCIRVFVCSCVRVFVCSCVVYPMLCVSCVFA